MSGEIVVQTVWGWPIALALTAAGAGGMTFPVITAYDFIGKGKTSLRRWGSIVSILAVIICLVAFTVDLGRPERALFTLLYNRTESWMARGVFILSAFAIFGLIYAAPFAPVFGKWFQRFPWAKEGRSLKALSFICGLLGVIVTLYSGFLLAAAPGIPFWNTPALPIVWLFSGASAALALLALTSIFTERGRERIESVHRFGLADALVISFELVVLFAYLDITSRMGIAASESARLLLTEFAPIFIIGAVLMGMVVPLVLELSSLRIKQGSTLLTLSIITAILVIVGCFLLRYAIIHVGVHPPLP